MTGDPTSCAASSVVISEQASSAEGLDATLADGLPVAPATPPVGDAEAAADGLALSPTLALELVPAHAATARAIGSASAASTGRRRSFLAPARAGASDMWFTPGVQVRSARRGP